MSVFDNFIDLNLENTMDKEYKQEIKKVLQEKFYCPSRFAQEIERVVQEEKVSYIDAIIYFCDRNKIDLDSVPKLLSKPLKEKIKCEAIHLNFLKKTSKARLVF
jgi:hypothetical protein